MARKRRTTTRPNLAPVKPNETVKTSAIEVKQNQTKPPPRYTEATLLSAMEGAGKLVEDDELREAMREKGLGTPATRAAIIEGLIYEQYVHRNGRELQAHGQGVFADGTAQRAGHSRIDEAGTDRRLGIQTAPDSAPAEEPRRVHGGNRRHDAPHRRARQEIRARHDPGRLRRAQRAAVRNAAARCTRTTSSSSA